MLRSAMVVMALSAAAVPALGQSTSTMRRYNQPFQELDQAGAWPFPWVAVPSSAVHEFGILAERGYLAANTYVPSSGEHTGLARLVMQVARSIEFSALMTVTFENFAGQGLGFYGRQNGGYLTFTSPHGQGYAVFLEGFYQGCLGLWYELDGDEIRHQCTPVGAVVPGGIQNGVPYRLRYEVLQSAPGETVQRARVWPASDPEPRAWHVVSDHLPDLAGEPDPMTIPVLQEQRGGYAVDVFNFSGTARVYVDDLFIQPER